MRWISIHVPAGQIFSPPRIQATRRQGSKLLQAADRGNPRFRNRRFRACPCGRTRQTGVVRTDDLAVPAVVVRTAGGTQGLGGSGVRDGARLRRGPHLRNRYPTRQAGAALAHHRRASGCLPARRLQRRYRRNSTAISTEFYGRSIAVCCSSSVSTYWRRTLSISQCACQRKNARQLSILGRSACAASKTRHRSRWVFIADPSSARSHQHCALQPTDSSRHLVVASAGGRDNGPSSSIVLCFLRGIGL